MELDRGQHVTVKTNEGGEFTGTVVFVNEHIARIRPDSDDIRRYLGDGYYNLGSAHWDSSIRPDTMPFAVNLPATKAEYLINLLHDREWGTPTVRDALVRRNHRVVTLTHPQVRHLAADLTDEDDGFIDEDGAMWIGGTEYAVEGLQAMSE